MRLVLFIWSGLALASVQPYGMLNYASDCEKELGKIPHIRCADGEEIPVFNSDKGVSITDKNHWGYHTQCDNPSLLRTPFETWISGINPCVPYARIGRLGAQPGFDTNWVFFCRRYFNRSRHSDIYDDINLIGHSPKTGATCFFVGRPNRIAPTSRVDKGHSGMWVPDVTSAKGLKFWKSPREIETQPILTGGTPLCTQCHDADPFVHSPHVDQVKLGGEPIVPSNPNGKYWIVGAGAGMSHQWKPKHLVSPQAAACTACHRIGNNRGCREMTNLAAGLKSLPHTTEAFRRFPFMPAQGPAVEVHRGSRLGAEELEAVQFIKSCCDRPTRRECLWEDPPR